MIDDTETSRTVPDARDGLRPVDRRVLLVMNERGMTQDFVLRYPLIDGQGNFGSIEGDPAAVANYTEARLTPLGAAVLADGHPSADAGEESTGPSVFPSSVPNLLINGAFTNATSIPPHNLSEVVDALIHLIDHPDATAGELQAHIKGPDFPTGGCIKGSRGSGTIKRRGAERSRSALRRR